MTLPDPERSRAVLIGASAFTDPGLPDLPAVRANLDGLAACLADPELWGLPAAHCVVVPDPESTVALVDPVHDASAAAEDTLLIYYAGHGLVHPRTLGLLLAVAGSAPGRTHTAVPYDLVRDNVIDSPAARKVVILDCCYSGRASGGMADPTTAVADEASVEGTFLMASAPANRQALSPPGETYTSFTGALLAVLTDGVPNGAELLSLDVIYEHVREALKRRSRPEPQVRAVNTAGRLALVRNRRCGPAERMRPGHLAGRYRLGRVIGGTPQLPVRLATDIELGRTVVVKPLPEHDPFSPDAVLEPELARQLDHPNIVGVLDVVPARGLSGRLLVTEYIDGRTLGELIRLDGRMHPVLAAWIAAEVCAALDHAHGMGILHGNINSGNVMLAHDGQVRVMNFGFRFAPGPGWEPPEDLADEVTIHSDIHDVGAMLTELITGQPASLETVVLMLMMNEIPGELHRIMGVAHDVHKPDERYRSAGAMRDDLVRLI